jgi:hypothetical protein
MSDNLAQSKRRVGNARKKLNVMPDYEAEMALFAAMIGDSRQ